MLLVCLVALSSLALGIGAGWLARARHRPKRTPPPLSEDMARKLRELMSTRDREMRESAEKQALIDRLTRSEANFKVLVEASPDPVFVHEDLVIRYVNPAMCRVLGCDRAEDLVGRKVGDSIIYPDDVPALIEYRRRREAGEALAPLQIRWKQRDGQPITVQARRAAITFDGVAAWLIIARDVSKTKQLEEQLRQAQKMDAIGRLAGGVAHDFNNLLNVVMNYAEFVTEAIGEGHPAAADVQEIAGAARRAAALTRQLLLFSRKQAPQTKIVALNSIVADLERMLSRVIGEDIRLTTSLAARPGSIEADASQLEQVLMNLVVNARDAMPGGGKLAIETADVELDDAGARPASLSPGRYVMLAVRDTGCGMDAATASRVFEPFFTTKEVGKGTGLGLSTVFGIMKQHGGGVVVDTEPGRGTTFRMYFPRVAAPVESLRPAPPMALPAGRETVLVVDDDERIRAVVRRVLAERGYSVLEARNAHAAFDTMHDRGDDVSLVVTDLVMPHVDGRSMAAQLVERHPHIRVLYMSGYTEHPAVKLALTRRDHFLQKPFGAQDLAQAVRRAIDDEIIAA